MHIEFEAGLQKLNSLSRRKFYPQQIDLLLNRAVEQFIKDSIRVEEDGHGFQKTQIDIDRIRPLITKTQLPAEFQETTTNYNEYLIHLPSDYSYLVSDKWYQAKNCEETIEENTINRYYYRIPIITTVKSSPKYYVIANLKANADIIADLDTDTRQGNSSALYLGLDSIQEKFTVVSLLKEIFSPKKRNGTFTAGGNTLHGLYFEMYGNLTYPNEFILVTSNNTATIHIVFDAVDTSIASSSTISYIQHSSADDYEINSSRLVKASALDGILETKYYQPQTDSPVSTIDSNVMRVFSHPNRIVNKSSITYIRQPQKINLALQRNCELADEFHRKIVDMAVEYAAGHIEAKTLKEVARQENTSN